MGAGPRSYGHGVIRVGSRRGIPDVPSGRDTAPAVNAESYETDFSDRCQTLAAQDFVAPATEDGFGALPPRVDPMELEAGLGTPYQTNRRWIDLRSPDLVPHRSA